MSFEAPKYLMIFTAIAMVFSITACEPESEAVNDDVAFTDNKIEYPLLQASEFNIDGTVLVREKVDKSIQVDITLSGTKGELYHPAHLHFGLVDNPDAEIAALLEPVFGKTGVSSTQLTTLSDGSSITFDTFLKMQGSIKVHLSDTGEDSKVVIAGSNIGSAIDLQNPNGRSLTITTCKTK